MPEESIIKLKRSNISDRIPELSSLEIGELALNTADGKIFLKISGNGSKIIESKSKNPNLFLNF